MSKYLPLFFLISLTVCKASIEEFQPFEIRNVNSNEERQFEVLPLSVLPVKSDINKIKAKWMPHIIDFFDLIDVDKVLEVLMRHIGDSDVINFIGFVTSKEFKDTLVQFQDIEEFKEAVDHLQSKGYDVESLINYINSKLVLPGFKTKKLPNSDGNGVSTLIKEIITVLPIEEMKKLIEEKLEKHQEIRELFETLSSEEFIHIIVRLRQNSKYMEIKRVFEGYGLDFEYLRALGKDIFGDYLNQFNAKIHD